MFFIISLHFYITVLYSLIVPAYKDEPIRSPGLWRERAKMYKSDGEIYCLAIFLLHFLR